MVTLTRNDLLAYLGKNEVGQQEAAQLDVILNAAYLMVKAYTRGRGFGVSVLLECEEDLAAVDAVKRIENAKHLAQQLVDQNMDQAVMIMRQWLTQGEA